MNVEKYIIKRTGVIQKAEVGPDHDLTGMLLLLKGNKHTENGPRAEVSLSDHNDSTVVMQKGNKCMNKSTEGVQKVEVDQIKLHSKDAKINME